MSDLIDRQAAIDYFVTNVGFHDEDGYPIEDECELREIWTGYFDGIPSAQPEQRTGKWIPQDHNKRAGNISTCVYYYPTCSECGKVGIETYKYCPHCGAKMGVTT